MSEIQIRDAVEEDSQAIADLLGQLGYENEPDQVAARIHFLKPSAADRILVAVVDGKPAGVTSLHLLPYFHSGEFVCRISALVVGDAYRSSGVGTVLLETIESFARQNGCQSVELTSAERRIEAHDFYSHRGYNRAGIKFYKRLE